MTIACIDTTSHSASISWSSSGVWCVASGLYGSNESTRMPSPSKPPLRGPADRAEADDAGGAAGELPGAVALVGDLAAGVHLRRRARRGRRAR